MNKILSILSVAVLAFGFSKTAVSASTADPFSFSMSGVIESANGQFSESLGENFEMRFTTDWDTKSLDYISSSVSTYSYLGTVSLTVDGYSFTNSGYLRYTEYDFGRVDLSLSFATTYLGSQAGGPLWGERSDVRLQYSTLYDTDASGSYDFTLPTPSMFSAPNEFDTSGFQLYYTVRCAFCTSSTYSMRGAIESVSVSENISPVPLPAAGWMLIAGLGMLGATRKFGVRR